MPPRRPNYKYFKCETHGIMKESGCFPDSVGVFAYNQHKKVRFCPQCFFELLNRECFQLKEVNPESVVDPNNEIHRSSK